MSLEQSVARDVGMTRFTLPVGSLIYPLVDSKYLNCTLHEVLEHWTFGQIHDAWMRVEFYAERDRRIHAAKNSPSNWKR